MYKNFFMASLLTIGLAGQAHSVRYSALEVFNDQLTIRNIIAVITELQRQIDEKNENISIAKNNIEKHLTVDPQRTQLYIERIEGEVIELESMKKRYEMLQTNVTKENK